MTEFNSNHSKEIENRQELDQPSGYSKAVTPPQKPTNIFAIFPDAILEDAEDETTEESIASSLCDIANTLHDIDEGIGYLSDIKEREFEAYKERTQAIIEENRLREEQPPEPTNKRSYPFKPSPSDRGGRKPRTEAPPSVQRFRELKRGGSR